MSGSPREARQLALAESAERELRLVAEAAEARAQSRAANEALARHLGELPALIERAIADAFAAAAPPTPPRRPR